MQIRGYEKMTFVIAKIIMGMRLPAACINQVFLLFSWLPVNEATLCHARLEGAGRDQFGQLLHRREWRSQRPPGRHSLVLGADQDFPEWDGRRARG